MTLLPQGNSVCLDTPPPSLPDLSSATSYRGVDSLPPEIISYIFIIGSNKPGYETFEDYESSTDFIDADDDDGDESSHDRFIHFATLCSHVCQYWRRVAITTCQLWSYLDFKESSPLLERSKVWIARSKDVPLAIQVDLTEDEPLDSGETKTGALGDLQARSHAILSLICPHVLRWKIFDLVTDSYDLIWLWQKRLVQLQSAPILEYLGIFCHEEWATKDVFHPQAFRSPQVLFPQGTPKIRSVNLWGVHFNWESVTFLAGLESLQLAWHTKDVRLTTEQFVQALTRSPKLNTLILEGSAPLPGAWPQERIPIPNLRRLGIMQIDLSDAISVVDHIDFPALTALHLDLENEDVNMFIRAVCQPQKPRFGSLRSLRLTSLNCSPADGKLFLRTLPNVKSMRLNFNYLPRHLHVALTSPFLCPRLETLKLSGLRARGVKDVIKGRKRSSTPIQRLYLDKDDELSEGTIQWLRRQVGTVEFFENSDDEDDDEEDDGSS